MKKLILAVFVVALFTVWFTIGSGMLAQERGRGQRDVGAPVLISSGRSIEDLNPQTLPFSQNWSNTGLITTDNDWSSVPGIIGYRGDGLTEFQGVDPQTIVADGSGTPVWVFPNRNDPSLFLSGGPTEFDGIANPVVSLRGSGTAEAPHLVISLNTSGKTGIHVAYNLRDIDAAGTGNSIQPIALQYRLGNSGDYTNIPAAFVADASTGPNTATLVTPVSVTLPPTCDNRPLVQLRVITTNAVSNDESIGIDDILITADGTGGATLGAFMSASPATVAPGANTRLTVSVAPATDPASTDIEVTGNLSQIGGSPLQQFFDNGTSGDLTPGDNVYSFLATIPAGLSHATYNVTAVASDAELRSANASVNVTVASGPEPENPILFGNPSNATGDVSNENNYLMTKPQYSLAYNRQREIPNWVAWRLDSSWIGATQRQDDYREDPTLPAGWYRVQEFDYSEPIYSKGHMCPSGDRTNSIPNNSATFLMTNFIPQHPDNNGGPWEDLEVYSRTLAQSGKELYIFAGGAGSLGTIGNGVTIPAQTWKVIVVLDNGSNDLRRVNRYTRVIAVVMPNTAQNPQGLWRPFRVSVDQIEELTGYNFLSNVAVKTQRVIEARVDTQ